MVKKDEAAVANGVLWDRDAFLAAQFCCVAYSRAASVATMRL